jgi:hypothetical protein
MLAEGFGIEPLAQSAFQSLLEHCVALCYMMSLFATWLPCSVSALKSMSAVSCRRTWLHIQCTTLRKLWEKADMKQLLAMYTVLSAAI